MAPNPYWSSRSGQEALVCGIESEVHHEDASVQIQFLLRHLNVQRYSVILTRPQQLEPGVGELMWNLKNNYREICNGLYATYDDHKRCLKMKFHPVTVCQSGL